MTDVIAFMPEKLSDRLGYIFKYMDEHVDNRFIWITNDGDRAVSAYYATGNEFHDAIFEVQSDQYDDVSSNLFNLLYHRRNIVISWDDLRYFTRPYWNTIDNNYNLIIDGQHDKTAKSLKYKNEDLKMFNNYTMYVDYNKVAHWTASTGYDGCLFELYDKIANHYCKIDFNVNRVTTYTFSPDFINKFGRVLATTSPDKTFQYGLFNMLRENNIPYRIIGADGANQYLSSWSDDDKESIDKEECD